MVKPGIYPAPGNPGAPQIERRRSESGRYFFVFPDLSPEEEAAYRKSQVYINWETRMLDGLKDAKIGSPVKKVLARDNQKRKVLEKARKERQEKEANERMAEFEREKREWVAKLDAKRKTNRRTRARKVVVVEEEAVESESEEEMYKPYPPITIPTQQLHITSTVQHGGLPRMSNLKRDKNQSQRVSSRISISANLREGDENEPIFYSNPPPSTTLFSIKRAEIMKLLGHAPKPNAKKAKIERKVLEPIGQNASTSSKLTIQTSPPTVTKEGPPKMDNKEEAKPIPSIRVDPEKYQAKVGPFEPLPLALLDQEDPREELIWTPPPEELEFNDEQFRNLYWPAIRRQFDGHVSHDAAMRHLISKNRSFLSALETIDDVLRELPEQPGMGIPVVKWMFLKPMEMDHHVTEEGADWDTYKFLKADSIEFFHFWRPREPQTEQRWACSNCTKRDLQYSGKLRPLCLICQTYEQLSGGKPRPLSTEPHFSKHDLSQMREWREMERREKRDVSRAELEKEQAEAETQRLAAIRKMENPSRELPEEQYEMVKKMWNLMIARARRVNRRRPAINEARARLGKSPLPLVEIPAKFESLNGAKFAELLAMRSCVVEKPVVEKSAVKRAFIEIERPRSKRKCRSIYARK